MGNFRKFAKVQLSKGFYIGASKDPIRRLAEHNANRVKSTKNRGPWIIRLSQQYSTEQKAKQAEYKLKRLKRRDYIEKIVQNGYIKLR